MDSEKDLIDALIDGVRASSEDVDISVETSNESPMFSISDSKHVSAEKNTQKVEQIVNIYGVHPEIRDEAVNRLNHIKDQLDDPEDNKNTIKKHLSWFEDKVPQVYYILVALDTVQKHIPL